MAHCHLHGMEVADIAWQLGCAWDPCSLQQTVGWLRPASLVRLTDREAPDGLESAWSVGDKQQQVLQKRLSFGLSSDGLQSLFELLAENLQNPCAMQSTFSNLNLRSGSVMLHNISPALQSQTCNWLFRRDVLPLWTS